MIIFRKLEKFEENIEKHQNTWNNIILTSSLFFIFCKFYVILGWSINRRRYVETYSFVIFIDRYQFKN